MTELTEPDNVPAQPAPEWPQAAGQDITDPHVAEAMARLLEIPRLPAADHDALYSVVHDELLAVLNNDSTDTAPPVSDSSGGRA